MKRLLLILLLAGCGSHESRNLPIPDDLSVDTIGDLTNIQTATSTGSIEVASLSGECEMIWMVNGDTLSYDEAYRRLTHIDSSEFWKMKFEESHSHNETCLDNQFSRISQLERELQVAATELTTLRGHKCKPCSCDFCQEPSAYKYFDPDTIHYIDDSSGIAIPLIIRSTK